MNWFDLILTYGISLSLVVLVIATGWVSYRIGYDRGHQLGWRQGLSRGQAFGRLKATENRFPDNN